MIQFTKFLTILAWCSIIPAVTLFLLKLLLAFRNSKRPRILQELDPVSFSYKKEIIAIVVSTAWLLSK